MGPTTIFDKSALQGLSMDESVWFDSFFSVNVTPIFFVEALADLEKELAAGRDAEDLVGMLAEKTPSSAYPNVHHRTLLAAELDGNEIAMGGKPLISAGETRMTEDGKVGIHIDEFPEQAGLLRWQEHDFLEIERELARDWRANLSGHDPDRLVGLVKNVLPDEVKFSDLAQLKGFVDEFCSRADPQVLALALQVVGPPEAQGRRGLLRWEAAGRPPLDRFFPYLAHVFKVDLLFYLGIHRGFISGERPSNRVDIAYLYYLPFGAAFTSGDRLHRMTVPLFLGENQTYLEAKELKSALAELDSHYDALPEAVKETGVLAFASYPPPGIDNAVTRLWDRHMRPNWRELAMAREAQPGELSKEGAASETFDQLKEELAGSKQVADQRVDPSGPDYFLTGRRIRATKGKWRMVSREVQEAGAED